jgi:hypothetical protein
MHIAMRHFAYQPDQQDGAGVLIIKAISSIERTIKLISLKAINDPSLSTRFS